MVQGDAEIADRDETIRAVDDLLSELRGPRVTVAQLAELLDVSRQSVLRWIREPVRGQLLPAIRVGARNLIPVRGLRRYLLALQGVELDPEPERLDDDNGGASKRILDLIGE